MLCSWDDLRKELLTTMGSVTWGTGIDTFGLNFLDAVVSDSGSSQWQTADAQNHVHVAFQCKEMKSYYEDGTDTNPYNTTPDDICFNYINDGGQWKVQYNSNENKPDGFFTRSCLLYNDGNGYHVVSDVTDIQRMIWEPNVAVNTASRSQIDGTTLSYTTYQINTSYNQGTVSIEKKNDSTIMINGLLIMPWLLAPDYLTHLMNHYSAYNEEELSEWGNNVKRENATYGSGTGNCKRYRPHFALDITQLFPSGNYQSFVIKSSDGNFVCELNYNTNNFAAITGRYYIASEHMLLLWIASCGLKFKWNNKIYKPIAENGVIVGYTDDMTKSSEWDNWHDFNDHEVPDEPPTPPTPVDPWDVDPETYGWGGGEVSGMVKYYLLTAAQMSSLQTAIASNANWTIDYLNCVVSCFVVPNSGIFFDAPIPTTVKFVLDNATQWDTGVACSRIQGTKNKSGGTIEIPRLTHTFYDFEPYSDYSIYIPFCGRIPIKGNLCLGREITVKYYPDVPTCSLTAVVSCGGATIAIAKGSFGTMTPVTSNGSDRKTAAVIGDVAPIITGIGTGIAGVALGNPLIVGAGAAQALGGIMGGVKESVQSYAYSVGSTGDSSFFGAGNRCYYYANYPIIDDVVNNSMFGHSVGYLCDTVGKLSSFTGFTICANPHVTFSATSEEREEIEKLLSMGVIL